jgi:hypothetical protein
LNPSCSGSLAADQEYRNNQVKSGRQARLKLEEARGWRLHNEIDVAQNEIPLTDSQQEHASNSRTVLTPNTMEASWLESTLKIILQTIPGLNFAQIIHSPVLLATKLQYCAALTLSKTTAIPRYPGQKYHKELGLPERYVPAADERPAWDQLIDTRYLPEATAMNAVLSSGIFA